MGEETQWTGSRGQGEKEEWPWQDSDELGQDHQHTRLFREKNVIYDSYPTILRIRTRLFRERNVIYDSYPTILRLRTRLFRERNVVCAHYAAGVGVDEDPCALARKN